VYNRVVASGPEKDKFATARLLVPSNQIGCLLGKGGIIIAEMRKLTRSNIQIFGIDQLTKCASKNDELVQVIGE
jgi:poly(rC)-binding protein 2/3/4